MTALASLIADAGANTTGAGPLTLILPLALLIIVLALWWYALPAPAHDDRQGRRHRAAAERAAADMTAAGCPPR